MLNIKYFIRILKVGSVRLNTLALLFTMGLLLAIVEVLGVGLIIPFLSIVFGNNGAGEGFYKTFQTFFDIVGLDLQNITLEMFTIGAFIVVVAKVLLTLGILYFQAKLQINIFVKLKEKIICSFYNHSYPEYTNMNRAEFLYVNNELSQYYLRIISSTLKAITAFTIFLPFVFFLSVVDSYWLLILMALFGVVIGINYFIFGPLLQSKGEQVNRFAASIIEKATLSFDGFKQFLLMRKTDWLVNATLIASKEWGHVSVRRDFIYNLQIQFVEFIAFSAVLFAIYFLFINGAPLPVVMAKIAVFGASIIRLKGVASQLSKFVGELKYSKNTIDLLEKHTAMTAASQRRTQKLLAPIDDEQVLESFESLELKSVNFSYQNGKKNLLQSINLTIREGDFVLINGISGSGKSTLLDVIVGLLKSSSGEVRLNKKRVDKSNELYFKDMAYVTQSEVVFTGSLLENILLDLDPTPERLKKAASLLTAMGMNTSPRDLNMQIGEAGRKLSGGQRQRLAIARYLFQEKSFVILDEATNALDKITEFKVLNLLKNISPKITVIVICHNLTSSSIFNKCYTLEDGVLKKSS